MKRNENGFTLLEITIVVVIIAIIFSIAVPNYVRSKQAAKEVAVIAALRALVSAQESFKSSSGLNRYGTLAELASARPPYIDQTLGQGRAGDHTVAMAAVATDSWSAFATPPAVATGRRTYQIDQAGQIHFTINGTQLGHIINASGQSQIVLNTNTAGGGQGAAGATSIARQAALLKLQTLQTALKNNAQGPQQTVQPKPQKVNKAAAKKAKKAKKAAAKKAKKARKAAVKKAKKAMKAAAKKAKKARKAAAKKAKKAKKAKGGQAPLVP